MSKEDSLYSRNLAIPDMLHGDVERLSFENAAANFIKSGKFDLDSNLGELSQQNIIVEFLRYDKKKKTFNNPFFDTIFSQLTTGHAHRLIEYSERRPFIMFRRTEPDPRVTGAILQHANEFHHDAVSFTEVELAAQNKQYHTDKRNIDTSSAEDTSMHKILQMFGNTIGFYPLILDDKIQKVFKQVNEISDVYETDYAIYQAIRSITDARNKLAGLGIPVGVGLGKLLEYIPSETLAQVLAQTSGEATAMFIAAAPKIAAAIHSVRDGKNTERHIQTPEEKKKKIIHGAMRAIVLAGTVGISYALSSHSQETNSLLPYAILPALNNFIIITYEGIERTIDYNEIPVTEQQLQEIQRNLPKLLRLALKAAPEAYKSGATISLNDMKKDPYTWGTLYGSILASTLTLPLEAAGFSRNWIYALTGMIIESAVAATYGLANQRDPYLQFQKGFKNNKHL